MQRARDGGRGFLHSHGERLLVGLAVVRGDRRGRIPRGQLIGSRVAPRVRHAALLEPLPVARHGGIAAVDLHHRAEDGFIGHLALAHVAGVRHARQEFLAIRDVSKRQIARPGQARFVDDEGHIGRLTIAVRPAGIVRIGQRKRDVVRSGVGIAVVRHRVVGGLRNRSLQEPSGVGLRGDFGLRDLQLVRGKRGGHDNGYVVGRVVRHEFQLVFAIARQRHRVRMLRVEHPLHRAGNDGSVPLALSLHDVVAQRILVGQRGSLSNRHRRLRLTDRSQRRRAGIAQRVVRRILRRKRIAAEFDGFVHAGVFVGKGIFAALEGNVVDDDALVVRVAELIAARRGYVARHVHAVLGGDGHLEPGLRVNRYRDLRRRVNRGIPSVRREDHVVEDASVLPALGHEGRIDPRERAADRRLAVHRRAAGQLGFGQRLAIEQARGRRSRQHRNLLRHRERDSDFVLDGLAVVVGIGHLHIVGIDIHQIRLDGSARRRFGVLKRLPIVGARAAADGFFDQPGDGGFAVAARREVLQRNRRRIGNGIQRVHQNLRGGILRLPLSGVDAVARASGRNGQIDRGFRHAFANPADEDIAVVARLGRNQRDVAAFDGVGRRVLGGSLAVADVVGDGVDHRLPVRRQGQIAGGSVRNDHLRRPFAVFAHRPSGEFIARAGGRGQLDVRALHRVGRGIGGIVLAAGQLVMDGVFHGHPAGIQLCVGLQSIRSRIEGRVRRAGGARVPSREAVVLARGILGHVHQRIALQLRSRVVALGNAVVIDIIVDVDDLHPQRVELQARLKRQRLKIHRFAGEIGRGIPAHKRVSRIVGQHDFGHLPVQTQRAERKAGVHVLLGVSLKDGLRFELGQLIERASARPAEIHRHVHRPVGVDRDVLHWRGLELVGHGAGLVRIPAAEGQALDRRIARALNRLVLRNLLGFVNVKAGDIVHPLHRVQLRGRQHQRHIHRRHDEGQMVVRQAVGNRRGHFKDGQDIAVRLVAYDVQLDPRAGRNAAQIQVLGRGRLESLDTLAKNDRQRISGVVQVERVPAGILAARHRQSGGDLFAGFQRHHNLARRAVEGRAARLQRPRAVLGGCEVQPLAIFRARGVEARGRIARIAQNVGHGAVRGIVRVDFKAARVEIEGQTVLFRLRTNVVAQRVVIQAQIAERADLGIAVLNQAALNAGPVDGSVLQSGRLSEGLLPDAGQIDLRSRRRLKQAAHHVRRGEGLLVDDPAVPARVLQTPEMGALIVEHDLHVHRGGGQRALSGQMELQLLLFDQRRGTVVQIAHHQIQLHRLAAILRRDLFVQIDVAGQPVLFPPAEFKQGISGIVRREQLAVDGHVPNAQRDLGILRLRQSLSGSAAAVDQLVIAHGNGGKAEAGAMVGQKHLLFPLRAQGFLVHIAQSGGHTGAVQRPALRPDVPRSADGEQNEVRLQGQIDRRVQTHFEVQRAHIAAVAREQRRVQEEHASQLGIGHDGADDLRLGDDAQRHAQLQAKADANADLAHQIHVVFNSRLELFLVGAALHLLEVVLEADLLAAPHHELHAEGGEHADLAHQIQLRRQGDDAVEVHDDDEQRNLKQIHIAQFRLHDGLHGLHDAVHGLLIIALEAVGLDQIFQRLQCLAEVRLAVAAGHGHLQLDSRGGGQPEGSVDPDAAGLHVHVHLDLLGEGHGRRDGHDRLRPARQRDGQADGHARRHGIAGNADDRRNLDLAGLRGHCRQRVGSLAVERVQFVLRVLRGHYGNQHLGAQLVVAANLRGHRALDLLDVLFVQNLFEIDLARRVHVQIRHIVHGIGVQEANGKAVVGRFRRNDLNEHDVAVERTLRPAVDVLLVRVDAAVVEADDLIRFKAAVAGVEQRAGDVFAVLVLRHQLQRSHVVPEQVLNVVAEDDRFHLIAIDAHQQGVDGFVVILEAQALAEHDGEAGAGLKAALSVLLIGVAVQRKAVLGALHAHGGLGDAAAGFDGDQILRRLRVHALRRDDLNGRQPVRVVQLGRVGLTGLLLRLVGVEHGVQRHVLRNRLRVAEALLAGLVEEPATEGIAVHGRVDLIHRLAQQILALRKDQRRKLGSAHGIKCNRHAVCRIDKARVERHLPVDQRQRGAGHGVVRVLVPRRENLALTGGFNGRKIDDAAGQHGQRFDRRAFRHKADDIAGQHQHVVRARLDGALPAVGVAHGDGALRLVLNRAGGPDGQLLRFALHVHDAQGHAALQHHFSAPADQHLADLRLAVAAKGHVLIRVDDDGFNLRAVQRQLRRAGDGQAVCVHGADLRARAVGKDQPVRRQRADLLRLLGDVQVGILQLAGCGQRFIAVDHRAEHPGQQRLHLLRGHLVLRRNVRLQIVPFSQRVQRVFRVLAQQTADVLRRILPGLYAGNENRRRPSRLGQRRKLDSRREERKTQDQ